MAAQKTLSFEIDTHNAFEQALNASKIMNDIEAMDSVNLVTKYKTSKDPINYAFQAIEDIPLKDLAIDFIKESITDFMEFISGKQF